MIFIIMATSILMNVLQVIVILLTSGGLSLAKVISGDVSGAMAALKVAGDALNSILYHQELRE